MLCSAGDFYGGADVFNEPKSHFVARVMGRFGYDAVAVGETDLNYGLEKLRADADKYGLPMTCANLLWRDEDGEQKRGRRSGHQRRSRTVFPPYRVVERGGVKIGFVAVLSPATKVRNVRADAEGEVGSVNALTYTIVDPLPEARRFVAEARKRCDVLVLLAHMDPFDLETLLPELPEVDLVIQGHSARSEPLRQPMMVGTVPVYRATTQGQNVGDLRVVLDAGGEVTDATNKVYFLDAAHDDDGEVAGLVDAFDKENRKQQKILYAKQQFEASQNAEQAQEIYLGVGSCMGCHPAEFDAYKASRHAAAYRTLSAQFMHRDTNCIGCHATGYGSRGGFAGVRRLGSPVELTDVQCEACHGPGAEHARDGSYRDRARASCTRCHTPNDDPGFDFDADWPKIAH